MKRVRLKLTDHLDNVYYLYQTPSGAWLLANKSGVPLALSNISANAMELGFALSDAVNERDALAAVAKYAYNFIKAEVVQLKGAS